MHGAHHGEIRNTSLHLPSSHLCCTDDPCWVWVFEAALQVPSVQQYLPIAHPAELPEPHMQVVVIAVSSAAVQVDPWLVDPWVCFGSALQVLSVQQYLSISHACVVPDTPQSQAKVSLSVSLFVHRFSFWSPSPFPSPWPFACLAQVPSPQQKYPAGHASGSVPSVGPQLHRFWTAVSSLLTVQIGGFGGTVNTIVTIGAPCIESESNHTFMQRKSPYPSPLHATLGLRCEDNRQWPCKAMAASAQM